MTTHPTLRRWMSAEWTIRCEKSQYGEHLVMTIAELPEFVVTGTMDEIDERFNDAFESYLSTFLAVGATPTLPSRAKRLEPEVRLSGEQKPSVAPQTQAAVPATVGELPVAA